MCLLSYVWDRSLQAVVDRKRDNAEVDVVYDWVAGIDSFAPFTSKSRMLP